MTDLQGRPLLKPGCRLSPSGDMLLIPEGALKLQGPARRIVELYDGKRSVREIASMLLTEFQNAEPLKVSEETLTFTLKLAEKGVIEFV
jgi:Coenzyme PQQ synthesis protein D (PqqD)